MFLKPGLGGFGPVGEVFVALFGGVQDGFADAGEITTSLRGSPSASHSSGSASRTLDFGFSLVSPGIERSYAAARSADATY